MGTGKPHQREKSGLCFSTPYSPQFNSITNIVRKYLPILYADETMREVLSSSVKFEARKASTLGNVVSTSMFSRAFNENTTWLSTVGFFKCGHNKCKACKFETVTNTFSSTSSPELHSFNVNSYINCNTKWVICLITCHIWSLQYVGCTSNSLTIRIRWHLSDVANVDALGISAASRHFVEQHQRDVSRFSFLGIERVSRNPRGGDWKRHLLRREARWIFDLGSRSPAGLNLRQDRRYHYC